MVEDPSEISEEELRCLLYDDPSNEANVPNEAEAPGQPGEAYPAHEPYPSGTSDDFSGVVPARIAPESRLPAGAIGFVEDAIKAFAERMSAALTQQTGEGVTARVTGTRETSMGDLLGALQLPTCFQVISSAPLSSPIYWDWSAQWLFPFIDRMLGGGELPPTIPRRGLTAIEQRLVRSVTESVLPTFAATWANALPLQCRVDQIESDPRSILSSAPSTSMLLAEIQIHIASYQGPFRIAFHSDAIDEVADILVRARNLPHTQVGVSAVLSESWLDANELLDLRVGDILTTDTHAYEPVGIYVDNELVHQGTPGARDGKKAVRIG